MKPQSMTRRFFSLGCGAGICVLAVPTTGNAAFKKVPTSTGIDALFAPFVVAAERNFRKIRPGNELQALR
jgi:hypothetical protein